jgi:hypothetical protein
MSKEFSKFFENFCTYSAFGIAGGLVISVAFRRKVLRNCALGMGIGGGMAFIQGDKRFNNIENVTKRPDYVQTHQLYTSDQFTKRLGRLEKSFPK